MRVQSKGGIYIWCNLFCIKYLAYTHTRPDNFTSPLETIFTFLLQVPYNILYGIFKNLSKLNISKLLCIIRIKSFTWVWKKYFFHNLGGSKGPLTIHGNSVHNIPLALP